MKPLFSPEQKKVLFFDVNQTMVMRAGSFEDGFKETWNDYAGRLARDDEDGLDGETIYAKFRAARLAAPAQKRTGGERQASQERALAEVLRESGVRVHRGFARDFFLHVKERQHSSKSLYPHVRETLEALAPHYTLAVISNSRKDDVEKIMSKFGLSAYFPEERRFTATRLSEKKPNAHLFLTALQSLQVQPSQCIMIGNSYRHDVCGAWKAGIDAIWIQRSAAKKNAPTGRVKKKLVVVKQFEHLQELLQPL